MLELIKQRLLNPARRQENPGRIGSVTYADRGRRVLVFGDDGQARKSGTLVDLDDYENTIAIERDDGSMLILRGESDGYWHRVVVGKSGTGPAMALFWE